MADIEILQKRQNVLLKRTEVTFRLTHTKEKTPQRDAVRDKIAATVGGKKDGVVIDYLRSRFGAPVTHGYAKIYESAEIAKKTEPPYLLRRHGLAEAKKPAGEAAKPAEAKKPAKPAEAKPATEAKPAAKPAEKKPAEAKPAEKPAAPEKK